EECVPGTRTDILSRAKEWLENPDAPKILWIVGAPGAGKSAVAASLVKKEFPGIHLCTKFFAKRDFADRRDPSLVWRTLIYDIARQHIGLRGTIMEGLLGNPLSGSNDQSKHCRLLFKAIEDQQCLPVVAVIDALDECSTEDHEQWRKFLQAVSGCADFPRAFKLVVTSRDLPDIREALLEVSQHILLPTGSNTTIEANSDIEKVFRSKLRDFPRASYWLSKEILPHLVECAAGSFIWAKMVVGLVQLNANDIVVRESTGGTEDVDVLYAKVLKETLGQLREEERGICCAILSAIIFAKEPLQKRFLEALPLNLNEEQVSTTTETLFENLRSIISVDENSRVRIPHKSFTDFFLDEDRCTRAMEHLDLPLEEHCTYLIRKKDAGAHLAIACLTWMKDNLAFNAYRIPTSHSLNENPQQLEVERIDLALVYACCYWGEHLRQANRDDGFLAQARPLLRTIFCQKVLFWLEILSLAKAVTSAKVSLMAAREFLEGYDNDLVAFAGDILKFVMDFEDPITAAASHIYISALPFCPSNSRTFRTYACQFPNIFSVTNGRREDWGDAQITGNGHDSFVLGVSFFRDGLRLASASWDKTVRIWDTRTGKATSPPFKHDSLVYSIAVSPDGKLIASGEHDGALSIWDSESCETGARKLKLTGAHSDVIRSVAFSPDGSRIVTGSWDMTVKVWDTASGKLCLGPLMGHTDWVSSVAFSPDGTLIASGSGDETIRIWDATTGKPHREPLVGHTSFVFCLAFTADGHYLASGSFDDTILLWNVMDGFTQASFINSGSPVYSISFSPKSETLVSGHEDGSLHFWDIRASELHQLCNPIHGHTIYVNSIAFSPDGLILASGSSDKSIKIWVVPTRTTSKASHGALTNSNHD
ncbi:WD40 repeat-like protein, partial [Schizopora paradoxa]